MCLDRRGREAGDLGIRDRALGLELVGECAEAGSEDDRDLRNDRGPRLDDADRIRNGQPAHFWPSSARSSASWRSSSARNPPMYCWNSRSVSALRARTAPSSLLASSSSPWASASASRRITSPLRPAPARLSRR